jgi:hypothetical protein
MLVEDIDHIVHNVAFDRLVLSVYGKSSFFGSLAKSIVYSYLHANVIDSVGTTTIIVNIKGALIKTHSKLIKKGNFLRLENFSIKAKFDYDKRDLDWAIELFTTTKMTIILPFDPLVILIFHPKDKISSFGQCMLQPFATVTITFVVIGVHGEIDGKFELLVADGTSLKDIQIVSIYITLSSFITLHYYVFNK